MLYVFMILYSLKCYVFFLKKRAANKVAKHITKNRTLTVCATSAP